MQNTKIEKMQRFHKWLYETVQNIHVLTGSRSLRI